jgi:2-dehydropantoate 2-reductase
VIKVLIIGTGAIGGLYGAKLSQAGAQVTVLCRLDYEMVKKNGIAIKSLWGNFHFTPHQVLKNLRDYKEEADFILVATKVLPEILLPDLIAPVLTLKSSIVLIQNGIHIEQPVKKSFPDHHLISVISFACVKRIESAVVEHTDHGRLVIGDFPAGICHKTSVLIKLWQKSGVPCEATANIQLERWNKLIWNASFNPISVLSGGCDTGEILSNPAAQNLVKNVMQEVYILAEADGFKMAPDVIAKNIAATKKMKSYKTSMLLDFEAKRKMEVDAILGNAVTFAKSKAISVPYLSTLYALLSCY